MSCAMHLQAKDTKKPAANNHKKNSVKGLQENIVSQKGQYEWSKLCITMSMYLPGRFNVIKRHQQI